MAGAEPPASRGRVPASDRGDGARKLALAQGQLEYRVLRWPADPRAATTLVLLHQGLGCVEMWGEFPEQLAAATGLPVLSYTRFGYAGSDSAPLPRPIDFMHREARRVLPAVLAAAGVGDHVLVGHSDGGSIALVYAGSPELASGGGLRGVVSIAAHVFNEPRCVEGIRSADEAYRSGRLRGLLARYHGAQVDAAFRGWRDVWLDPAFARWSIERFLPEIRVPLLTVQGADDPYGSLAQIDAMQSGAGGSVQRAVLPDCGHSPHQEQPQATLRLIAQFLESAVLGRP